MGDRRLVPQSFLSLWERTEVRDMGDRRLVPQSFLSLRERTEVRVFHHIRQKLRALFVLTGGREPYRHTGLDPVSRIKTPAFATAPFFEKPCSVLAHALC